MQMYNDFGCFALQNAGVGGVGVGKYNDLTFRLEFTNIIFLDLGDWSLVKIGGGMQL